MHPSIHSSIIESVIHIPEVVTVIVQGLLAGPSRNPSYRQLQVTVMIDKLLLQLLLTLLQCFVTRRHKSKRIKNAISLWEVYPTFVVFCWNIDACTTLAQIKCTSECMKSIYWIEANMLIWYSNKSQTIRRIVCLRLI